MTHNEKLEIIKYGIEKGISNACRKYNISRTIYYRWQKRMEEEGIEGLRDRVRQFNPVNKVEEDIEKQAISLMMKYPNYGPKAIKYLLEDLNIDISESAVFNIMKRNNLTNKTARLNYIKHTKNRRRQKEILKDVSTFNRSLLMWIEDISLLMDKVLYKYCIIDNDTKIASSRLYQSCDINSLEDFIDGAVQPLLHSIKYEGENLYILDKTIDLDMLFSFRDLLKNKLIVPSNNIIEVNTKVKNIISDFNKYTNQSIINNIKDGILDFKEIKRHYQKSITYYSLERKQIITDLNITPMEYYRIKNSNAVLPLWVRMPREY